MIEPFQLEGPLIVVGLDTVVVGNIDALADWCETDQEVRRKVESAVGETSMKEGMWFR